MERTVFSKFRMDFVSFVSLVMLWKILGILKYGSGVFNFFLESWLNDLDILIELNP